MCLPPSRIRQLWQGKRNSIMLLWTSKTWGTYVPSTWLASLLCSLPQQNSLKRLCTHIQLQLPLSLSYFHHSAETVLIDLSNIVDSLFSSYTPLSIWPTDHFFLEILAFLGFYCIHSLGFLSSNVTSSEKSSLSTLFKVASASNP